MPIEDFADFIASRVPKGKVVELGIGFQFKVALRLKELGYDVLAVDWNPASVEKAGELGINAVRDDLFSPNLELYRGVKALYSVRPTPEIVRSILELGKSWVFPSIFSRSPGTSCRKPCGSSTTEAWPYT